MLQVARLAPRLLGDSARLVEQYVRTQINPDGGFRDRAGASDIYYTVFGLESLLAVRAEVPRESVAAYLARQGDGEGLDLVHLCCLARAWADIKREAPSGEILARIEQHRSGDGGYHATPGSPHGTVYACFLALGAYQDLNREMPRKLDMLGCIGRLRSDDGGYANQDDMPMGLTPATAAAVMLLRHLDQPVDGHLAEWLLARCRREGGFFAAPMAPIPDLLSTATALHALASMQADLSGIREPCLDFIDALWTSSGSFYGHYGEDALDCEYTYYGLLALGHLSV